MSLVLSSSTSEAWFAGEAASVEEWLAGVAASGEAWSTSGGGGSWIGSDIFKEEWDESHSWSYVELATALHFYSPHLAIISWKNSDDSC